MSKTREVELFCRQTGPDTITMFLICDRTGAHIDVPIHKLRAKPATWRRIHMVWAHLLGQARKRLQRREEGVFLP